MHDLPRADGLLLIARANLLDKLLPHLPPEQKYTALMVANAMAIAAAEQAGEHGTTLIRQALLLQSGEAAGQVMDDPGLCQALRAGRLDKELVHLLPALRTDVEARLQVSNPRYLHTVRALRAAGETACPS